MIVLMNDDLRELYETGKNRRYRMVEKTPELREGFVRAVRIMTSAVSVDDIKAYSFLHYERLKHGWSGYSSIRLSNRFVHRLLFKEIEDKLQLHLIEIDDTHYGNKK